MDMSKKEETWILQGLLDWMGFQVEETGEVPTTEEMDVYLLEGYGIEYDNESLEELRALYTEAE